MDRVTRLLGASPERLFVAAAMLLGAAAAGCTPKIGDKCVLSTDCSQQGTLVCDTSQPEGYCTQLNCTNGSCPNDAVCVEFQSSVPGCMYQDYASPSRTGRAFCMAHCSDDSDCRQSEGYTCGNAAGDPWNAAILDNNQSQKVCIVAPGPLEQAASFMDAAVCMAYGVDAGLQPPPDAGGEGGAGDGGMDAGDAAADAAIDAGVDAGLDATLDAPIDTGVADATGDGD